MITIFSPLRIFLPISVAAFVVGAAYGVWTIVTQSHVTNASVLLILLSVVDLARRPGLRTDLVAALRGPARRDGDAALVIVPTYNERENLPVARRRR